MNRTLAKKCYEWTIEPVEDPNYTAQQRKAFEEGIEEIITDFIMEYHDLIYPDGYNIKTSNVATNLQELKNYIKSMNAWNMIKFKKVKTKKGIRYYSTNLKKWISKETAKANAPLTGKIVRIRGKEYYQIRRKGFSGIVEMHKIERKSLPVFLEIEGNWKHIFFDGKPIMQGKISPVEVIIERITNDDKAYLRSITTLLWNDIILDQDLPTNIELCIKLKSGVLTHKIGEIINKAKNIWKKTKTQKDLF